MLPGIEINRDALPNQQLHLSAAVAYDSQSVTGTEFGYGDTTFGAKYRFVDLKDGDRWPQIAVYPAIGVSTGNAARGPGIGATHAFLSLRIQKDFGAWTTYGGGGYGINPGPANRNDRFFGWQLERHITGRLVLGGEVFHQTASTTGEPGSLGFPFGSKPSTGFNIGRSFDFIGT